MKRFIFFFFFVFALASVAIAADDVLSEGDVYVISDDSSLSGGDLSADGEPLTVYVSNLDRSSLGSDLELTNVSILQSVAPVTPSDASGLKAVLLQFVGDYDPVIIEYQYQSSNGYYSYLREVQPDYPWMISCALLVVMIYCLFRLGGALFCRR